METTKKQQLKENIKKFKCKGYLKSKYDSLCKNCNSNKSIHKI